MTLTQISTAGVKDDAVTAGKIPADAIGSSEIAANAVGSSELATDAVTTAKIADQAVTLAKLEHGTSSNNGKFLRANNGADPSFETVDTTTNLGINFYSDSATVTSSTGTNVSITEASSSQAGLMSTTHHDKLDGIASGATYSNINGNVDNRVLTATGTTGVSQGEANLTFTSDVLQVSSTTSGLGAKFINTGNEYTNLQFSAARTAARNALGIINAKWNNNDEVAAIYLQTGDDTTNKDDGVITFYTKPSGGNLAASMVIHPNGNVTNARQAAMSFGNADNITNLTTSHTNDPIHFSTTQVNKGGMSASNTMSRITVPTAGVYLCTGMYSGSGTGSAVGDGMQLNLYRNGSIYPEDQAFPISSTSGSSGEEWSLEFSILANASANDYFEIAMSNIDTNNAISAERGNFCITLLH